MIENIDINQNEVMIENTEIKQSEVIIENIGINQEMFKIADELFDVTKISTFSWDGAVRSREPHFNKRIELIKKLLELSVERLFKDDIKTHELTSKIVHGRNSKFWEKYCEKYAYTKNLESDNYKDTAMRFQAKDMLKAKQRKERLDYKLKPSAQLILKAESAKRLETMKQLKLQATIDPDASKRLQAIRDKSNSASKKHNRKKLNLVSEMDETNKLYGIKWIGRTSTNHRKTGYAATKYLRELLNDETLLPELEASCWDYQTWKKETNNRKHQLRNDFKFTHPGLIKYGFSTIIIEYQGSQHLDCVQAGVDENKALAYAKTKWSGIADEIGNMNPSLINRMKMITDNDYARDKCKLKDNTNQNYVVVLGFDVKSIIGGLKSLFCNIPHPNVFKKANEVELYGQLHRIYENHLHFTNNSFTWCVNKALREAKLINKKSEIIEQDEDKSKNITNSTANNDNNVARVVQPASATDESCDDLSDTNSKENESDTESNESESDADFNESELNIHSNENGEKNDVENAANEISADLKNNTKSELDEEDLFNNGESKQSEELIEDSHYMPNNIYNFKRRFDNNCIGVEFIPKIKTSNLNIVQK